MRSTRPLSGQEFNLLELFLAVLAAGFSIAILSNLCQDYDEKILVKQAQLPEGPASALFDFEETYYYEPMLISEECSDSFVEPVSWSIASPQGVVAREADTVLIEGQLKKGESLDACLKRYDIAPKTRYALLKSLGGAFDLRKCLPGERFKISLSEDGRVLALIWEKGPFDEYKVVLDENGSYSLTKAPVTVESRMVKISGQFTAGLYDSFANYGLGAKVARQFSDIFSSSVDFNSDIRVGDSFSIILTKYYKNGKLIGIGKILAAKYCTIGGSCTEAYYFANDRSRVGYYRPDGTSLSNSFLRSPLKVYKITSRFNSRRFHPILKVYRPHYGVDLAAPIGTPIMAVADGTVTFTGWQRGYGRIVVLRHKGGYKTYYGHLLRFAKGLKKGVRVHQKQVIGYVGRSGYATGPHLDYRVWHNGRFVDPLRIRMVSGRGLSGAALQSFIAGYKQLEMLLRDNVASGIISVKKETLNRKPTDLIG